MIKQSSIENLLNSIDIVDVISSFISLKKAGLNWVGLCPFHDDKNPSMYVNSQKQFYHCFSCKAGGNAIKFVMDYEKLTFIQAVEKLADMFAISLEYTKQQINNESKNILNILNNYYKTQLFAPNNKNALEYLQHRGLNSAIIEKFELGFAPNGINSINLLKNQNINLQDAIKVGVIKNAENGIYASFSNRITFPIFNHFGTLVGFGGRSISNHPAKYINSPQSEIFDKSRILYGYDKAKNAIFKKKEIIICEGYMDCIMLHLAGIDNAVAVLGTALTQKHLPLLNKENIKVILSFDSDDAGVNAALKSAELLSKAGIDGKVVLIQGAKDPAELIADKKINELINLYKGGIEFIEFILNKKVAAMPLNTPLDKIKALDEIRSFMGYLRPEIISAYDIIVANLLKLNPKQIKLAKNKNSNKILFQNEEKRDLLSLSVAKNMLINKNFYALGINLINSQMFKETNYYYALLGDKKFDFLLRELVLDESLEEYKNELEFQTAIKKMHYYFLLSQKEIIKNSNDSQKIDKIKQITLKIEELKKEINNFNK